MRASLIVGVVAGMAVAGSARADIIDNGGFETGDFSGWNVVVSGELEVANFGHTGQYSARFGYRDAFANYISQGVSGELTVGETYRIDLWVYNLGVDGDYLSAGNLDTFGLVLDPVGTELEQWSLVSHEFVYAASANHFAVLGYDNTASFYVDDVSITLVPAPAVAGLAGAGVLGMARRRR